MDRNIEPMLTNQYGPSIIEEGQEEKLLGILNELSTAIDNRRKQVANIINNK